MVKEYKVYRHVKSGHIVRVLHIAKLQTEHSRVHLKDMQTMVVYTHGGNVWVRSEIEFNDGRFTEV